MNCRKSILLFVVLAANIASATWLKAGDAGGTDGFDMYFDPATIRRSGMLVKMWRLLDEKRIKIGSASVPYQSSMSQDEYDCKAERIRSLAFTYFGGKMGQGEVLFTTSRSSDWSPVAPGSVDEAYWKIACGK